jgi:hypothetical protein
MLVSSQINIFAGSIKHPFHLMSFLFEQCTVSVHRPFAAFPLSLSGLLSLLCGASNRNKILFACRQHEIQYTG